MKSIMIQNPCATCTADRQEGNPYNWQTPCHNCKKKLEWELEKAERIQAIEGILGDDYDLDRLRELVEADRDGRCVVLTGKSKKNELIRDLVKIIKWISDSIRKHDFSPFRIVAGAPENTFPVVLQYNRVIEKHEEEIYLAFKDEEVAAALKGEQDEHRVFLD